MHITTSQLLNLQMETGKNRFFNICEAYQSMLGKSDSVASDARRYKNINESFERTNKICESTEHNFNVDEYLKRVKDNSRFFFTEGGIYKCDDGHTLMQVVDYYSPSNIYTTLFTNGHGLGSADVWAKKAYSHDGEVTVKPTDVDMEMTSRCANMRKMLLDAYYIPGWFMPVLFNFHIEDSENFILSFEKLVKEKPAFEKILLRDEADVARLIEEYPDINSIYGTDIVHKRESMAEMAESVHEAETESQTDNSQKLCYTKTLIDRLKGLHGNYPIVWVGKDENGIPELVFAIGAGAYDAVSLAAGPGDENYD